MQRALWTSQRLSPDQPVQNTALLSHIDGSIDADRLAAAFATVVARHDVLRTRIERSPKGDLVRVVNFGPDDELSEVVELSPNEAQALAERRCQTPLDMTDRGFDSVIIKHADGTCSWYLNLHHVITDATSSALVFAATAEAYFAETGAAGDADERASYYQWSESLFGPDSAPNRATERAAGYWAERADAPPIDRLYRLTDRRAADPDDGPATASRLPVDLTREVAALAADRLDSDYRLLSADLSWTAVLTTAMAAYLHRISGASRFSIGVPVHNRTRPETRTLIGPTMEVFPVDIEVESGDTFRALHRRVGKALTTTLRHAAPGTSPKPDFAAVVNMIRRADQSTFGPYRAATKWIHPGAVDRTNLLRLQLTAYDTADPGEEATANELILDINHRVADAETRQEAPDHLGRLLAAMMTDPDQTVTSVALLSDREQALVDSWGYSPPLSSGGSDHQVSARLLDQLANNNGIVITGGDGRDLTGLELKQWIESTARWIDANAPPGGRVAIELSRSIEAVVAIMATLTSGRSFVPIDTALPDARRQRLIERAGCELVISARAQVGELAAAPGDESAVDYAPAVRQRSDEAYLLYTSGSTGEPKGVPITLGGLADYLEFAIDSYVEPSHPVIAPLFSALTFDLTITTLFVPLLAGGRLIVIDEDGPAGLARIADHPEITWLKATPSHLEILHRLLKPGNNLRTLIVGGEAFGSALARRLLQASPSVRIFNEYGPTEAVVGCMIYEVERDRIESQYIESKYEVPIGRPAPGVTLKVVDAELRPVPPGVAGELLIHHRGVTAGYLDPPSGADDPFVAIGGVRFYRSGDLVRLDDSERLVYLGRIDDQVKIGGRRLEPIEVEQALVEHPAIERAAVRVWSPPAADPAAHCVRCGLPDNVPGVAFDDAGICETCYAYDAVALVTQSWFKNLDDLQVELDKARSNRTGQYDVLHLLSGGKDSTYALYQLVEMGARPYAVTLDNGFISEGAKDNVRRSVADLGIDHEFVTTEAMNAIFADSLAVHSNVCNGCYKTIYTLATNRAAELGIPLIVTGLSRGQLFETRLIPQQFDLDRFDPDAIDRAVLEARKIYHRTDDAANRLLNTELFATDDVFNQISYLDFYRYIDVELSEMYDFLTNRAPWVRPADTGRSTNCLINAAGIHTHLTEQGYHNYAIPYAWDVRLGHKTREEAIEELDDQLDLTEVSEMLDEVGYQPRRQEVLTAWIEPAGSENDQDPDSSAPDAAELRSFLAQRLPDYAIPAAFVEVEQLPMTVNGKLDTDALPEPQRVHRPSAGLHVAATTETERRVVAVWEKVLGIEPISIDDDFFAIGGDSLAALEAIVALSEQLKLDASEDMAFRHTTPRLLAQALDQLHGEQPADSAVEPKSASTPPPPGDPSVAPQLTTGQRAILFDQANRPHDVMYNIGRVYRVEPDVPMLTDLAALERAVSAVAERHQPLHWTYGPNRRRLTGAEAVNFTVNPPLPEVDVQAALVAEQRQPFALEDGPLLRWLIQPSIGADGEPGSTSVQITVHHVAADADSFDLIWQEVAALVDGRSLPPLSSEFARFTSWSEGRDRERSAEHWLQADVGHGTSLAFESFAPETDGYISRTASLSSAELSGVGGASAFALVLTAIGRALAPYCDGDKVEVGLVTSTRTSEIADQMVGYFQNTIPFVIDRDPVAVSRSVGAALAARTHPLVQILADRRAAGLASSAPAIYVSYTDFSTDDLGAVVDQRVLDTGSSVVDATIFVQQHGGRITLGLEYRGTLMSRDQAAEILTAVDRSLLAVAGIVTTPDAARAESRLVGPSLPDSVAAIPSVLDPITAHLRSAGDDAAVVCGADSITWSELEHRSRRVAAELLAKGLEPGEPVLVDGRRSVDSIVQIVGTLRAGGAYVAIDPSYPEARRQLLAEQSGAQRQASEWSDLTADSGDPADVDLVKIDPEQLAYIIFTSGSTGEPKPVAINHHNLSASTMARPDFYDQVAGGSDSDPFRFLMVSSTSFDSSVAGLFWTLAQGGTLVLPTEDQVHDVNALYDLMVDAGITHTLMVPTLYQALLGVAVRRGDRGGISGSPWPDQIIVAGEACPQALVDQHYRLFPTSRLTNEYGPTEATVWATGHHVRPADQPVPIGRPIAGTTIEIVGPGGQVRPHGVSGELVIRGAGVAAQFDGRYATGDRAVIIDDNVYFLGRLDNQLNVGGTRVEPEEIERVLASTPGVESVVVVVNERRQLVAHATPVPGAPLDHTAATLAASMASTAETQLPPLWRPALYGVHDTLPVTANGKTDRDAAGDLPVSNWAGASATSAADRLDDDPRLAEMSSIFAEVLGQPRFGPDQAFSESGGHSLLAIELLLAVEKQFGSTIPVPVLYRDQTPRALLEHLDRLQSTDSAPSVASTAESRVGQAFLVPIQPRGTKPPIFAIHVLGIDSIYFRPLAARLGPDQPLYGLGQPTADANLRTDGPTAVADVAAAYVREINLAHPDGPIIVTAISLGGTVAFETAQQLRASGRDVALLALFDAAGPAAQASMEDLGVSGRIETHLNALREDPVDYVVGRAAYNLKKLRRWSELAETKAKARLGMAPGHRLDVRRFIEANIQSQLNYEFEPYDAPMVVYKAAEDPFTGHFLDIQLGWTPVADGGLTVRVVEGDHLTMVAEPHVEELARLLRQDIADHLGHGER